jgi:hypothetical protein
VKDSNEAFEMLLSSTMAQLKKVEGDSFLPVDIRPNGRPLFGPALNVFWTRAGGLGAGVNRKKDQKAGKLLEKSLCRAGARTRWVTERIASPRRVRNQKTK